MSLYAFRYPEDEFPPLGIDRGDKTLYFDEYSEHVHYADWNWCAHCGDGSSSTHNPQWRRREHFEEFHRQDVRRAVKAEQLRANLEGAADRSSPSFDSATRWCKTPGCDEVIPAGSNPRKEYHSDACREANHRNEFVAVSKGTSGSTTPLRSTVTNGGSPGTEKGENRNALRPKSCAYGPCGGPFVPENPKGRYCSDACKQAAYRQRTKAEETAARGGMSQHEKPLPSNLLFAPVKEKKMRRIQERVTTCRCKQPIAWNDRTCVRCRRTLRPSRS